MTWVEEGAALGEAKEPRDETVISAAGCFPAVFDPTSFDRLMARAERADQEIVLVLANGSACADSATWVREFK